MNLAGFISRLLAALVLWCGVASANALIVATGVDSSRGASLLIREDGADVQTYFAGVIFISVTSGNQVFYRDSLCVDLFTNIYLGQQYDTTLLQPDNLPQKNLPRASWLVDNAMLPAQNSTYLSSLAQSDWVSSSAQGEGIQLAIWDIVHDGGDGFSAGRVQAAGATDPAVLAWAQRYEALSLGKSDNQAFVYSNVDLGSGLPAQMLIGPQFADAGPQPVPEPQTLMPAGMALIAVSLGLRWRIRKRP